MHILRQRSFKAQAFSRTRVGEFQCLRMQSLSLNAEGSFHRRIFRITNQRIAQILHVYANLVRASGSQATAHNGIFAKAFQHLLFGNSVASAFFDNSHLFTVVFVTGDECFNHAAVCFDVATHYSKIGTLSGFSLYLL